MPSYEPFITIIIPTYNSANTLNACIDSIINQTFTDKEILIIDGSSNDSTLDIINRYAADYNYIKWKSEKDNGIWDAMNKGIRLATGKWLLFLGSDDTMYDKDVLTNISSLIQKKRIRHIIYGNVKIKGDTGWANNQVYDGPFTFSKLLTKNICHQGIFYNRDVFKQVGLYNTKYRICSDYDMNFRCFAKYQFHYADYIIANFNSGGESTNGPNDDFAEDFHKIVFTYFSYELFNPALTSFRQFFLPYAKYFFKKGNYYKSMLMLMLKMWHSLLSKL